MSIDDAMFCELLRKMLLTRKMEQKHDALLKAKVPVAFGHFGTGAEAIGIGATAALRKSDVMIGTHRGFCEYIGKGMKPADLWAEYLGKKGLLDGKAGIQVSDRELNIPALCSCLGGGFALAVGMAFAIKKRKEDRVVVLCYGDGTYNQSDAHPAMIVASSLKLPLIFHVTNNGWVEHTRTEDFLPTKTVAARGAAYNITSQTVDGQCVDVVYEAARQAVEHARSGQGPYLIEYMTYRMCLHWSSDKGEYINDADRAQQREWAKRDPIELCKEKLIARQALTEQGYLQLVKEVEQSVEAAVEAAMRLPDPDRNDLYAHVFAQ